METCGARFWHDQRQVWTINMTGFCFKINSCEMIWQHVIQIMVRGNERLWLTGIRSQSIDLILAILNDDPCSVVIWECLHNWNFPMQSSICVCVCVCVCECASDVSLSYFFLLLRPRAVLPLDCITCSAPVWLSLVGWWSFLAGYENQSEFLAPTFPHTLHAIMLTVFSVAFSFQTVMLPSIRAAGTACLFVPRWRWR